LFQTLKYLHQSTLACPVLSYYGMNGLGGDGYIHSITSFYISVWLKKGGTPQSCYDWGVGTMEIRWILQF